MRFRDEHLDLEFDARPISFLLACNRIENIRPELLSRVQVIEVLPPSPEQMPTIIRSVDAELRSEMPQMHDVFLPLSDELIASMPIRSRRNLGATLKSAYARAGWRTRGQGPPSRCCWFRTGRPTRSRVTSSCLAASSSALAQAQASSKLGTCSTSSCLASRRPLNAQRCAAVVSKLARAGPSLLATRIDAERLWRSQDSALSVIRRTLLPNRCRAIRR